LPKKAGEIPSNFFSVNIYEKKHEIQEYFPKKSGKVVWHNVDMKQIQINQCFNEESSLGAAAASRPKTS
jgi:hypothetical protein